MRERPAPEPLWRAEAVRQVEAILAEGLPNYLKALDIVALFESLSIEIAAEQIGALEDLADDLETASSTARHLARALKKNREPTPAALDAEPG